MGVRNYRDLVAWQRAMDLVDEIYKVTKQFPKEEMFGLTSQIRRAVVSIPSNIAEGQGRQSKAEFRQFLSIAHGSIREVETQVMIASRQSYLSKEAESVILGMTAEVGRLTRGLMNSLSNS
ncbi:MAG: four helix bundle protein [Lyngbya sp. HA4199-MV5]|nr:four helix bundle protein [Lyngbya sp. HA4199-MV5]